MKRIVVFIVLFLTACGGSTSSQLVDRSIPQGSIQTTAEVVTQASIGEADNVHGNWVNVLESNDQPTGLKLVAPGKEKMVIEALRELQEIKHDPSTGTLTRVDIHPTTPIDGGRQGYSIFTFGHRKECYTTKLAYIDGKWKVVDWLQSLDCSLSPARS